MARTVWRVRSRVGMLASPVFVLGVALLAINDHALKERVPGLLTGKLSDIAGLVVVAVLLGVLLPSRTVAVMVAGLAFLALKTIPAVGLLASPLLGGRTLADSSDLLALAFLLPTWWWLGHQKPTTIGAYRSVLVVLGALAAMLALTATSCYQPVQVTQVSRAPDGSMVARVRNSLSTHGWGVSRDGRRWVPTHATTGLARIDAKSVCSSDGKCFRVVPGSRVETRTPSAPWSTVYHFTAEQRQRRRLRSSGCRRTVGLFSSVAIVGSGRAQHVVVVMGSDGVLWRGADGRWQRRAVLDAEPVRLDGPSWLGTLITWGVLGALVLLAAGLLVGRLTTGRWIPFFWIAAIGMVALLPGGGFMRFLGIDYVTVAPIVVVLAALVLLASAAIPRVARRLHPRSLPARRITAPGWYVDPERADRWRWWDGQAWTENVSSPGPATG